MTDRDTKPEPLAWLREQLEAATPGRWHAGKRHGIWAEAGEITDRVWDPRDLNGSDSIPNARAIALAHNVLPELVAVAEAASEWLDHLRDARQGQYADGVPGELMDQVDALDARIRELMEDD